MSENVSTPPDFSSLAEANGVSLELLNTKLVDIPKIRLTGGTIKELSSRNVIYVGDLVQQTEEQLLGIDNFGSTRLDYLKESLLSFGLALNMKPEETVIAANNLEAAITETQRFINAQKHIMDTAQARMEKLEQTQAVLRKVGQAVYAVLKEAGIEVTDPIRAHTRDLVTFIASQIPLDTPKR